MRVFRQHFLFLDFYGIISAYGVNNDRITFQNLSLDSEPKGQTDDERKSGGYGCYPDVPYGFAPAAVAGVTICRLRCCYSNRGSGREIGAVLLCQGLYCFLFLQISRVNSDSREEKKN